MIHADAVGPGRRGRRRRAVSEKLEIVGLTMEPGASVAEIARAHGVNANQVFKWRRLFERGQLSDGAGRATALLPVAISAEIEDKAEPIEEASVEQTSWVSPKGPRSVLRLRKPRCPAEIGVFTRVYRSCRHACRRQAKISDKSGVE